MNHYTITTLGKFLNSTFGSLLVFGARVPCFSAVFSMASLGRGDRIAQTLSHVGERNEGSMWVGKMLYLYRDGSGRSNVRVASPLGREGGEFNGFMPAGLDSL